MMSIQKCDWTEIDGEKNASDYLVYLNKASSLKAIQDYKARTYAMLGSYVGSYVGSYEGMQVLDVGCGTGNDVMNLSALVGSSGAVVGIDRSNTMISQAQLLNKRESLGQSIRTNIQFIEADAEALPFDSNSFDACRADRVLQHLADPSVAISEMMRVTRSGGLIVVAEPDWETLSINSIYPDTSRALKNLIISSIKTPSIGAKLPGLFYDAGIIDLQIDAFCLPLRDFELASELLLLNHAVELAKSSITPEKLEVWISEQRSYCSLGKSLLALTGFAVAGRKR